MRHSCNPQSIDAKDILLHEHLGDGNLPRRLWEKRMELPKDIRLKIKTSIYKEIILKMVERLKKKKNL